MTCSLWCVSSPPPPALEQGGKAPGGRARPQVAGLQPSPTSATFLANFSVTAEIIIRFSSSCWPVASEASSRRTLHSSTVYCARF